MARTCPKCQTANPDGTRFCGNCGNKLPPVCPSPSVAGATPTASPPVRQTLQPGTVFAGYRIERLLATGAMGAVYLAEDPNRGRKVAVKVQPPAMADAESIERFRREAGTLANLQDASIVTVLSGGAEPSLPCLVAADAASGNLDQLSAQIPGRASAAVPPVLPSVPLPPPSPASTTRSAAPHGALGFGTTASAVSLADPPWHSARVVVAPARRNVGRGLRLAIAVALPICLVAGLVLSFMHSSTWQAENSGTKENLFGIACPGSGRCLAVGENGTILASTDGGATWRPESSGTPEQLNGIACPGSDRCLAVGEHGTILASADGGATWRPESSGTPENLVGIACPAGDRCLAVRDGGTILASTDGGTTWQPESSGTTENLVGIACPSSDRCLAVGVNGTILASTDGGATWRAENSGTMADPYGIACPSSDRCLAVRDGGTILTSMDGGATWQVESGGSGTTENLFGIACLGRDRCLAVGENGTILASTDG